MTKCPCGASWTGLSIAHCPTCHRTFSTVAMFDRHRVQDPTKQQWRVCKDPAAVGLVQNPRGQWTKPDNGYWAQKHAGDAA